LKPYWGKPAVRNFREGGGDVLMVWWPFAPKPERADTLEVTDLHSGAPPLYSTISVVRISLLKYCIHMNSKAYR
jgi:hypothetical protein